MLTRNIELSILIDLQKKVVTSRTTASGKRKPWRPHKCCWSDTAKTDVINKPLSLGFDDTLPSKPWAKLADERIGYHWVYYNLPITNVFRYFSSPSRLLHRRPGDIPGPFFQQNLTRKKKKKRIFLNQGEPAPSTRPWRTQGLLTAGSPRVGPWQGFGPADPHGSSPWQELTRLLGWHQQAHPADYHHSVHPTRPIVVN